jgi:hypothetical protein
MTGQASGESGPNELADLVGPFWSRAKVSEALGVDERRLTARVEGGDLLELRTADGVPAYPVFQFERDSDHVEVRPALASVFRTLRDFDPWTVAVLLHTPAPELSGSTPLEWLRSERAAEPVVGLAQTVAKEWAAGSAL